MVLWRRRTGGVLTCAGAVALVAALSACGAQKRPGAGERTAASPASSPTDENPLPLAGPHWNIWEVADKGGGLKRAPRGAAWVKFDGAGQASGNFGCHAFRAKADIKGDRVTVSDRKTLPGEGEGEGGGNEEKCDPARQDYEKDVQRILNGRLKVTTNYAWVNLTNEHGSKLVLRKGRPVPFVGSKWEIAKLNWMDEEWPVDRDAPVRGKVYFTLDGDGTFHGNFGCNDYRGKADVGAETITFSHAEPTSDARCSKETMKVEEDVRKRFDQTVRYQLGPDYLTADTYPTTNLGIGFVAAVREN
ncbi:META domain-containing protein [Streptomyces sp. NPDC017529]|uniref:META domain-containing protein n=1 Tax=Streptomyces sp. NPDC017529 TaxID=3365000 RepID=UPI0037BAFCC8